MKISDLITSLQEVLLVEGDLPVKVSADQSQVLMGASWSGVSFINKYEEGEYMIEGVHEDDIDKDHPEDYVKILEIQGY